MREIKQYTVEDVRAYVANIRAKDMSVVWEDVLPTLRAKFPEQLIIRYMKST